MKAEDLATCDLVATYQVFPPFDCRQLKSIVCVDVERRDRGWVISDGLGSVYSDGSWIEETESDDYFSNPLDAIAGALNAVESEINRYEEETEMSGLSDNVKHLRRQNIVRSRVHLSYLRTMHVKGPSAEEYFSSPALLKLEG